MMVVRATSVAFGQIFGVFAEEYEEYSVLEDGYGHLLPFFSF
ncbi:hypothetical protein P8610_20335 [Fictibacillus sp. UD]